MKVSIVTISYNQARFLERALRSVLEQDYADIEYIVVDPGSTDGSRDIIERYRDRIDRIILKPDDGPADGLNKGFAAAAGSILAYLNSDDELLPGAVREAVALFQASPHIDVIVGDCNMVDADGRHLRRVFSDAMELCPVAYGAAVQMQPSTFFRAEAFRAVEGFNSMNPIAWDQEILIRMAMNRAKFALSNRIWSNFRLHSEGISGAGKLNSARDEYFRDRFVMIMGREYKKSDIIWRIIYLIRKYLKNPKKFFERVFRGPTVGRFAHSERGRARSGLQ